MALASLHFFCDETSYTGGSGHRFAAVGGIVVNSARINSIDDEVAAIKTTHRKAVTSELKWEKINRHDLQLYEDCCRYFFSLLEANYIHFHVVICNFKEYDHRTLNHGDKCTSVSKTYYQLLLHRGCKLYGEKARIHARPDRGDCSKALPGLQGGLNADARRRFGLKSAPIASINPVESKTIPIMHLNDIVLGAIASHRNGRQLEPNASPHKARISDVVLAGFGLTSYAFSTPKNNPKFSIWNWQGTLQK
jgi:hypothetical protein